MYKMLSIVKFFMRNIFDSKYFNRKYYHIVSKCSKKQLSKIIIFMERVIDNNTFTENILSVLIVSLENVIGMRYFQQKMFLKIKLDIGNAIDCRISYGKYNR